MVCTTSRMAAGGGAGGGAGMGRGDRADLLITNARVWTGEASMPEAGAVAVRGDRIVAVGSPGEIDAWRGPSTVVVDAQGRRVIPGFHDAHLHLLLGGIQLDAVDLKNAASPADFVGRIGERARSAPAGEWVLGGGWDEQAWEGAPLPSAALVDPVTPATPVFVSRYDLHAAMANSVALGLAGITPRTPDPPGGTIVRDDRGRPTGVLKDAAMSLVHRVIPPMTAMSRRRTIARALAHMAAHGITSAHDMGPEPATVEVYRALASEGALTARIRVAPLETEWLARPADAAAWQDVDALLTAGAVKGFSDGSLGSRTAYFFEPYTDAPDCVGLLSDEMLPLQAMRDRLVEADRRGQQLCIHAIGDRAVAMVLDLFEDVRKANGPRERRWRIEHAQHMPPSGFARFASLGVIASVQPYHAADDGRWAEKRIGPVRAKTTHAYRSFIDHGVRLAIGTDWPVAPLDPLANLHAAVTRETLDGAHPGGWVPEQRISMTEALGAYTLGSAYAEFREDAKGSVAAGKLADLVILSGDILQVPSSFIKDVHVAMTIAAGRIVYRRGSV